MEPRKQFSRQTLHRPNSLPVSSSAATVGSGTRALPMRRNHWPAISTILQKWKRHACRFWLESSADGFLYSVFLKHVGLHACEWLYTWQNRPSDAKQFPYRWASAARTASEAAEPSILRKPVTLPSPSVIYRAAASIQPASWSLLCSGAPVSKVAGSWPFSSRSG